MPTDIAPPELWEDLLVTPENRSAMRAAERFVEALTQSARNDRHPCPLVFHGPTGCGKSAIVKGIIRRVVTWNQPLTVQSLPAMELPREPDELSDLRTCDLLAIEDLQHLRPADYETFRLLLDTRNSRRRLTLVTILSGPAQLTSLPRRITNRLVCGLVVRLDPFGLAARSRFADWYACRQQIRLSPAALAWLASHSNGPRQLTGMIDALCTAGSIRKGELSDHDVRALLADPLPPTPILDRIARTVGLAFRVTPKELLGASRLRTVLIPRQVAMFLAREVAKLPLVEIGKHFGGRDHTTVMNAVRKIEAAIQADAELAGRVLELRRGLD